MSDVKILVDAIAYEDLVVSGSLTVLGTTTATNSSSSFTYLTASNSRIDKISLSASNTYDYVTTASGRYDLDTAIDQLDARIATLTSGSNVRSVSTGSFSAGAASVSLSTSLFPTADLDYITLFTSVKYVDNKWRNDLISYELYVSGSTCKVDLYCDDTDVTQFKIVAVNEK